MLKEPFDLIVSAVAHIIRIASSSSEWIKLKEQVIDIYLPLLSDKYGNNVTFGDTVLPLVNAFTEISPEIPSYVWQMIPKICGLIFTASSQDYTPDICSVLCNVMQSDLIHFLAPEIFNSVAAMLSELSKDAPSDEELFGCYDVLLCLGHLTKASKSQIIPAQKEAIDMIFHQFLDTLLKQYNPLEDNWLYYGTGFLIGLYYNAGIVMNLNQAYISDILSKFVRDVHENKTKGYAEDV